MGTLGAGNHYAEIQVVDQVFDAAAARKMGINRVGQARCPALALGGTQSSLQISFAVQTLSLNNT